MSFKIYVFDKLRHDAHNNIVWGRGRGGGGEMGVIKPSKCIRFSPFVNDCSYDVKTLIFVIAHPVKLKFRAPEWWIYVSNSYITDLLV